MLADLNQAQPPPSSLWDLSCKLSVHLNQSVAALSYRQATAENLGLTCNACMQLITNGGKSVHPSKVHYRTKDPLEKVDWFQAGAHSIPETEDFLRMIGHFADSDHDLHAFE